MDQFEDNRQGRKLLATLLNASQGIKLEKSVFTFETEVNKMPMFQYDDTHKSAIKDRVERDMCTNFGSKIYEQLQGLTVEETDFLIKYRLKYIVLKPENLKEVVEYVIRNMTDEAIAAIKLK